MRLSVANAARAYGEWCKEKVDICEASRGHEMILRINRGAAVQNVIYNRSLAGHRPEWINDMLPQVLSCTAQPCLTVASGRAAESAELRVGARPGRELVVELRVVSVVPLRLDL